MPGVLIAGHHKPSELDHSQEPRPDGDEGSEEKEECQESSMAQETDDQDCAGSKEVDSKNEVCELFLYYLLCLVGVCPPA